MKSPQTTVGCAAKIFAFTALAAVLCFFLHMSVTMALSMAGTTVLGQRDEGKMEDGRTIVVEYYNPTATAEAHRKAFIVEADGSETMLIDKPAADFTEEDANLLKAYPITENFSSNIRSQVDPATRRFADWVAQILMVILFLAFPYSDMWYLGDGDRNRVQFGHAAENKTRGLLIGVLASIPAAFMWCLLVVGKMTGGLAGFVKWYRWFNMCFLPYFKAIIPDGVLDPVAVPWGGVAAMLPVLLILPLMTGLGYFLGYKEFSVRDRMVYATTGKKVKRRRK